MPPAEDYAALEQEITQRESVAANEIAAYQRQIDALDTQIADASKIDEETQAAHDRRLKKGARHQKVVVRSYRRSTDRGPSV